MLIHPPLLDCWYLTGCTASGKTDLGISLAQALDAEIVSLDSMALYRGMDVGTAKPSLQQQGAVPHHLIDIIEPAQDFSLAEYVAAAHAAAAEIRARGKAVLFVGGTPLYLKSLLRGLFTGPPPDWNFRQRLQRKAEIHGLPRLHESLRAEDPAAAEKIHPGDARRIIRALEVRHATGTPLSSWQRQFEVGRAAEECRVFVLDRERSELHDRIQRRVTQMFSEGFVKEVEALIRSGTTFGRTASQAVGYREVLEHREGGTSLDRTMEQVVVRTRRFARRQSTWFRSLSECRFMRLGEEAQADRLVEDIQRWGNASSDISPA